MGISDLQAIDILPPQVRGPRTSSELALFGFGGDTNLKRYSGDMWAVLRFLKILHSFGCLDLQEA